MPSIFIALGSNIDPENNLKAAATMLREHHPAIRFSTVYRSAPLHHEDQDEFLNAVATFESDHPPEAVLALLGGIERHLKKNPPFRFGPRTIDLDLLLHGQEVLPDSKLWKEIRDGRDVGAPLVLPHPRMHERRFVLEPLTEFVDPLERHPILEKTWQELLQETLNQQMEKIGIRL